MLHVVTGATGHLGNNLVRALVARGEQVRALIYPADPVRPLEGLPVERVEGDVRDIDSLRCAFDGADIVYHLAGLIAIEPSRSSLLYDVNVMGTRNVVEACLERGVRRLVYTASIHALVEPPHGTMIDEHFPFDPSRIATDYGRSKAQAALEVLDGVECGLDAVIVSPTGIIGPHDYQPSEMGRFFLMFAQRRLPVCIAGAYDFVDVRDVAEGLIAAAQRGRRGHNYILSGEQVSIERLLAILSEETGVPVPRLRLPTAVARAAAAFVCSYARARGTRPLLTTESVAILASNSCIRHDKATRELGYAPRPIEETVRDTIRWFVEAGLLVPAQPRFRWAGVRLRRDTAS
ncbi:MAG: SDR family oxidoreductase [Chloroflexia bacterium]